MTASDGDAEASIDVTIMVDDVDEPPEAPPAPTATPASPSSLEVLWTAPPTPDRPSVKSYDLRYKQTEAATFERRTAGSWWLLRATIDDLTPGTAYEVQVRARNDEGDGPWSPSGRAETALAPVVSLALNPASIRAGRRGQQRHGDGVAGLADRVHAEHLGGGVPAGAGAFHDQ